MLKFLLLIALAVLGYYAYKFYKLQEAAKLRRQQESQPVDKAEAGQKGAEIQAEDMVACPTCGVYRPRSKPDCETPGCAAKSA